MDILQIFLVVSLVLLTGLLVFLGIQVYFVLQELRVLMKLTQKTMENVAEISEMTKNPVFALTQIKGWGSVLSGLREGIRLYKTMRRRDE